MDVFHWGNIRVRVIFKTWSIRKVVYKKLKVFMRDCSHK